MVADTNNDVRLSLFLILFMPMVVASIIASVPIRTMIYPDSVFFKMSFSTEVISIILILYVVSHLVSLKISTKGDRIKSMFGITKCHLLLFSAFTLVPILLSALLDLLDYGALWFRQEYGFWGHTAYTLVMILFFLAVFYFNNKGIKRYKNRLKQG